MLLVVHHFFYALPMTLLFWSLAYATTIRRKKVSVRWSRIIMHILIVNVLMAFASFVSKLPNPDGSPPPDSSMALLLISLVLAFVSCTLLRAFELRHINRSPGE